MKKCLGLLLLMVALLDGCVVAVVAGVTVAGVVVYEGRGPKTLSSDGKISYDAEHKIFADKELDKKARVIVSSFNGVVLLAGETPTEAMRTRAGQLVQTVPGIKRMYNEIIIGTPISTLTQSSDGLITSKIKTQLLANKSLNGSQMKIVTENGTVFMLGQVTRGQGKTAADIASRSSGVQKVVTLFEYVE
jgi:osmotically-inducible protein OsmY